MRVAIFLALVATTRADTSIATPASDFDPKKCSMNDSPYRRSQVALAKEHLQPPGTWLKQAGRHHALYGARAFDNPPRSAAIDRRSKREVAALPVEDSALVEDERGELVGLLTLDPPRMQLFVDGKPRWSFPNVESRHDSATTLVAGKLLVVALFPRIATGAALIAFDLEGGARVWTADVVQMNVDHSKYFNDVSLERRGDVIVMRGYEAAGCYQQTFELSTGKRLSSTIR